MSGPDAGGSRREGALSGWLAALRLEGSTDLPLVLIARSDDGQVRAPLVLEQKCDSLSFIFADRRGMQFQIWRERKNA